MQTREQAKAIQQTIDQIIGVAKKLGSDPEDTAMLKQYEGLYNRLGNLLLEISGDEREEWTQQFEAKVKPLMMEV